MRLVNKREREEAAHVYCPYATRHAPPLIYKRRLRYSNRLGKTMSGRGPVSVASSYSL